MRASTHILTLTHDQVSDSVAHHLIALCKLHLGLLSCKREGDLVAAFKEYIGSVVRRSVRAMWEGTTAESFLGKRCFCELPRVAGSRKECRGESRAAWRSCAGKPEPWDQVSRRSPGTGSTAERKAASRGVATAPCRPRLWLWWVGEPCSTGSWPALARCYFSREDPIELCVRSLGHSFNFSSIFKQCTRMASLSKNPFCPQSLCCGGDPSSSNSIAIWPEAFTHHLPTPGDSMQLSGCHPLSLEQVVCLWFHHSPLCRSVWNLNGLGFRCHCVLIILWDLLGICGTLRSSVAAFSLESLIRFYLT